MVGVVPRFIEAFERFRRAQREAAELLFEYQVFSDAMTPPDRLLYLARFLEAYHRGAIAARKVDFVDRVTDLLTGPGAGAGAAFGGPPEELARVIKDTRNYYVHYDPTVGGAPCTASSSTISPTASGARCAACCGANLGMPEPMITKILETDWRYQAAARSRLPTP